MFDVSEYETTLKGRLYDVGCFGERGKQKTARASFRVTAAKIKTLGISIRH